MSLFSKIPANFFSVLSSPNKEIYVQALMELNKLAQQDVTIEVDELLTGIVFVLGENELLAEEDFEEDVGTATLNQKARLILYKLIKTGWVDKETSEQNLNAEVVVLHDYSLKTLQLLELLSGNNIKEYNSLVFATYSSLKQARQEEPERMYDALLSARSNTSRLMDELRSLYHTIRDYHRTISGTSNFNEMLASHFDDYKALVDKVYHPIKTMDSIHRYAGPIRELILGLLDDDELLLAMVTRAISVRQYSSQQDAEIAIRADAYFVLESYKQVGRLVDRIDQKHSNYTKYSIERMRYLLTADRTIKSKLVDILKRYGAGDETDRGRVMCMMREHIDIDRQECLDDKSVYRKNIRSRRSNEPPLRLGNHSLDESELESMVSHFRNSYSRANIGRYITTLMEGKQSVSLAETEIPSDRDFTMLMLASILGTGESMQYSTQIGMAGEGNDVDGYTMPDISFERRMK